MWMKLGIRFMCAVIILYFLFHNFPFSIEDPVSQYVLIVIIVTIMTAVVIPLSGMLDTDFMNRNKTNEHAQPKLYLDRVPQDTYKFKLKIFSRQRLVFLALGMILNILAYSVGAIFVKININEAETIKRNFQKGLKGTNQYNIFINNFRIALEMFVPVFGIVFGAFSGFSTGLVYNAFSVALPRVSHISPFIVFLTPYAILEEIAYGIAISRSGVLSYQLIKDRNKGRPWQEYVIPTVIEVGIILVILLIAAMIELQMIQSRFVHLAPHEIITRLPK